MKKGTLISVIALSVAVAGALFALAAYFTKKKCVLCDDFDDFDDDLMSEDCNDVEYYAAEVEAEEASPLQQEDRNPTKKEDKTE